MSLKNWKLCDLHIHRYLLLYIKMKNEFIFLPDKIIQQHGFMFFLVIKNYAIKIIKETIIGKNKSLSTN